MEICYTESLSQSLGIVTVEPNAVTTMCNPTGINIGIGATAFNVHKFS